MHYGALYLLAALACASAAALSGGPAWILLWPAASWALLASAYGGGRRGLVGMYASGRRAGWAGAVLGPWLAWRWLVGAVSSHNQPAWHEIAEGLYLGRMARFDEMPPGVDLVLDLTAERAADPRVIAGRTYRCLPTLEGTSPEPEALVELVAMASGWEGRVLVHGEEGGGRAAMVMAMILLERGRADAPADALALIGQRHPEVRVSDAQRAALEAGQVAAAAGG